MEALILDVGGVLLVPHEEPVSAALAPFGIELDGAQAERAHYFGIHALDLAAEDESAARLAYLVGYADAAGVPIAWRAAALERLRQLWRRPTVDLWRRTVKGSVEGLQRLGASGRKI